MTRATVDFGIDLGTTNSIIAVPQDNSIRIIKNADNQDTTPSVVWIDQRNSLHVGSSARDRLDMDSENAYAEFKRQMGMDYEYRFKRSGRVMTPVDLSTEVLKSMKADVQHRMGEDLTAAVITVPAAFGADQADATLKASQSAGFQQCPLLQEPVAAALAYSFDSQSDKVFWLVYDLGGGTFDTAVINVRDGMIQVVNHGGDNHLGGKNIDWAIVESCLIPSVNTQYKVDDFHRGNRKWSAAIAKLKMAAEEAKIALSRQEIADINIEFLGVDAGGQAMEFNYELTRKQVQDLSEPLILRTINTAKKVLSEKRLGTQDIEKLVLVGGPTLMPYLRQRLADSDEGLGIPLEFNIDPLTVVAQGAAIFATTQRLQRNDSSTPLATNSLSYHISFPDWKFRDGDPEPLVAGLVTAPNGSSLLGHTIEFVNKSIRPPWRSGQISLEESGTFMTTLWSERDSTNTYTVELRNSEGRLMPNHTDPDPLRYDIGLVIDKQPLIQSLGVALADNSVDPLFEKGKPLPARARANYRTTVEVRKGQSGNVLRIPIIEGENSQRADRNRIIGTLEVTADQVTRDVPLNSEVEFAIDIDESRIIRAKAYIPILDEEFEEVIHLGSSTRLTRQQLDTEAEQARVRLIELQNQADETKEGQATLILMDVANEKLIEDVEDSISAADADPDASDRAESSLRELQNRLDEVEKYLEWPLVVQEAEKLVEVVSTFVDEKGNQEDRQEFQHHKADVSDAIASKDADLLRQRVEELRGWWFRMLDRTGIFPVLFFQHLISRKGEMNDQSSTQRLEGQGLNAIQRNDIEGLRDINRQLTALLPVSVSTEDVISTVMVG